MKSPIDETHGRFAANWRAAGWLDEHARRQHLLRFVLLLDCRLSTGEGASLRHPTEHI
jgi:hypothetical protein